MNYQSILFDLDGTLTDSKEGILNTLVYTLNQFGINETDEATLLSFIGPPLRESFITYYNFSEEQCQKGIEIYRDHYRTIGVYQNCLFPGVLEFLQELKSRGYRLAIATAKGEWTANKVAEMFHIKHFFDFIVASNMAANRNHKHQIIELALTNWEDTPKESIVMIGDRNADIDGARRNGIDSIAVTFGYGSLEELQNAQPAFLARSFEHILEILAGKNYVPYSCSCSHHP